MSHRFIVKMPSRNCMDVYSNAFHTAMSMGTPGFVLSERSRITSLLKRSKTVRIRNALLAARTALKHAHLVMRGKVAGGSIFVYCKKKQKT